MTDTTLPRIVVLPFGLSADIHWLDDVDAQTELQFVVPDDYEIQLASVLEVSEVLSIQRLLTVARRGAKIKVQWEGALATRVTASPTLYPLLAVLVLLRGVDHQVVSENRITLLETAEAKRKILSHRVRSDLFSDREMAVCVEGESTSLSADLYDLGTLKLLPREHFETLAVEVLAPHLMSSKNAKEVYGRANLLGVILGELVENSEMHGRLDLQGRPIINAGVRGLVFRRVSLQVPIPRLQGGPPDQKRIDCVEASVFDSGIGYFESYTRRQIRDDTDLNEEWQVLHNCLERHYHPELPDLRPGHRGLGLYEVLRALQALRGRIEVRTGRLFAYRTFLEGEIQAQMEARAKFSHLAWPIPRLLDVERKYFAKPTKSELLVGSSVRILVPVS